MADGRLGKGNLGDNEEGDEKENEEPKCWNGDDETPTREAETAKQRGGSPQRRIMVYLLQAAQSSGGRYYGRTTTPDAPLQVRKTRSDQCVAPESCCSKFDCNTRTSLPLASLIQ